MQGEIWAEDELNKETNEKQKRLQIHPYGARFTLSWKCDVPHYPASKEEQDTAYSEEYPVGDPCAWLVLRPDRLDQFILELGIMIPTELPPQGSKFFGMLGHRISRQEVPL